MRSWIRDGVGIGMKAKLYMKFRRCWWLTKGKPVTIGGSRLGYIYIHVGRVSDQNE